MKKNLTSKGFKILSILLTLGMVTISIALFFTDEFYWVAVLFSIFVTLFCAFAVYISFFHQIYVKEGTLIIQQVTRKKIYIKDSIEVTINDESMLNQNIIFIETEHEKYKLNGYNALRSRNYCICKTKIIVKELQDYLQSLKP